MQGAKLELGGAQLPTQSHTEGLTAGALEVWVAMALPQPSLLTWARRPSAVEGGCSCTLRWPSSAGGVSQVTGTPEASDPGQPSVSAPAAEPRGTGLVQGAGTCVHAQLHASASTLPAGPPTPAAMPARQMCREGPGLCQVTVPRPPLGTLSTADTCPPAPAEREAELTAGSYPAHTPSHWGMCLRPGGHVCVHTCACLHLSCVWCHCAQTHAWEQPQPQERLMQGHQAHADLTWHVGSVTRMAVSAP